MYNSTIKNLFPHSSFEDLFFESLYVLPDVLHHGQHQVEGPAFTWIPGTDLTRGRKENLKNEFPLGQILLLLSRATSPSLLSLRVGLLVAFPLHHHLS